MGQILTRLQTHYLSGIVEHDLKVHRGAERQIFLSMRRSEWSIEQGRVQQTPQCAHVGSVSLAAHSGDVVSHVCSVLMLTILQSLDHQISCKDLNTTCFMFQISYSGGNCFKISVQCENLDCFSVVFSLQRPLCHTCTYAIHVLVRGCKMLQHAFTSNLSPEWILLHLSIETA